MFTLGINAAFHDSSASIVKDGMLLAAAEEERFTHIKHGKRPLVFSSYEMPFHAVDYCLKTAGIQLRDVDHVAYSFDPALLKKDTRNGSSGLPHRTGTANQRLPAESWDSLFRCYLEHAPEQLCDGFPHHLSQRFQDVSPVDWRWHYVDHHLTHAASAFFPSPYDQAAVMVIDGRGESVSTSYYEGHNYDLEKIGDVALPHSLGLLYEQVTSHLGFLHSSDEYKVMALASFGKPGFLDAFRSLIDIKKDGTYQIKQAPLEDLLGPRRRRQEPFSELHFDIAHSLQLCLQESVLELVEWLHRHTRKKNLCLAGGVALNCVLNAVLRDKGPFEHIWVQPAAGDAGTALGAALWIDAQERLSAHKIFVMDHAYYGPSFDDQEVETFLQWSKLPYRRLEDVASETARLLAADKVVGWFQGRMEFGPRALGARSILASPIHPDMQEKLNEIKDREDFRPVAPVVLEEDAAEWFEQALPSPFMLFVSNVRTEKMHKIPAATHVDGTARIQTINRKQHPLYYDLLKEFKKRTGVPVLINTSFNTRGEPVVCTPRDAIECFWTSPIDVLVINNFMLEKSGAPKSSFIQHEELSTEYE